MSRPVPPPRILVVEHEPDAGIGLVGERLADAGAELVVVGPETGRAVPHSAPAYDGGSCWAAARARPTRLPPGSRPCRR